MLRSVGKIPLFHKLAVVLSIAIVFGIVYNFVVFPSSLTTYDPMRFADLTKCKWDAATDPVLFNLRTKLGVNYEASHWFHIAENFMVHHSILRAKNELANASEVFYNFDKGRDISLASHTFVIIIPSTLQKIS